MDIKKIADKNEPTFSRGHCSFSSGKFPVATDILNFTGRLLDLRRILEDKNCNTALQVT